MAKIIVKDIKEEDFVNYKKPSMFLAFPYCDFKCDRENGSPICQNSSLVREKDIEVDMDQIIQRYLDNPITKAMVFGGLEPFDSYEDMLGLVLRLRAVSDDEVVIYTGYKEAEISLQIAELKALGNIIIKFGRFIPDQDAHFDPVLGVNLASSNQYAKLYK